MAQAPEVVVVGAGIVGASIAWHLTAAGAAVTVIDAVEPGGIATAGSFAWINASWGNPEHYFRLRVHSMAGWRRLAEAVPAVPIAWVGGLCWDLPRDQLLDHARKHGSWGYGVRSVNRTEAARIEPQLVVPPDIALHVPEEGAVEPVDAARALLRDAQARGARPLPGTPAHSLRQRQGKIVGVETKRGYLAADEVVLAAGVGTPALLATAGLDLAMSAPPGLLAHTRLHARLLHGVVLAPELHMRQTAQGRIVIGADFGGADPGADPTATAKALLERAKAMLKDGDDLELEFHTIGYRPTPAGGFPAIGRPDGQAGLYVAVMHSGVTLAPAVGEFVTEELLSGRRDPLLAPFAPADLNQVRLFSVSRDIFCATRGAAIHGDRHQCHRDHEPGDDIGDRALAERTSSLSLQIGQGVFWRAVKVVTVTSSKECSKVRMPLASGSTIRERKPGHSHCRLLPHFSERILGGSGRCSRTDILAKGRRDLRR